MDLVRRRLLRIGATGALALSASAAWVLYDQPTRPEPDLLPDPGSHESTAEAAKRVAEANAGAPPMKKGMGVDVTPP